MAYATIEDIRVKYGSELVNMIGDDHADSVEAARDALALAEYQQQDVVLRQAELAAAIEQANAAHDAVIQRNLDDASAEVGVFIHDPGWDMPPDFVREATITIAVYKICLGSNWRTDEMRRRYEDVIKILEKMASGKLQKPIAPINGSDFQMPVMLTCKMVRS